MRLVHTEEVAGLIPASPTARTWPYYQVKAPPLGLQPSSLGGVFRHPGTRAAGYALPSGRGHHGSCRLDRTAYSWLQHQTPPAPSWVPGADCFRHHLRAVAEVVPEAWLSGWL